MAWIVRRNLKSGPRYYVRYLLHGKRYWFSAGKTLELAKKVKAKLETEIAEDRFLERRKESTWTLQRLADMYLAKKDHLKPRSAKWRRSRFEQILRILGPDTRIETIDGGTLERMVEAILAAGNAASTANGTAAVLRDCLSCAYRWRAETGLAEYRLRDWRPVKGLPKRRPTFLTPAQVRAILRAARRRGGHPYLFLRVFLATGARPGEILRLRPLDVRKDTIWFETLKDGVDRFASVPPELARELRRSLPFSGSGEAKNRYRRFWRAVRKEAGVAHVRLYDLRHTAISRMLEQGASLRDAGRAVGHRDERTTRGYAHFSPKWKPPKHASWKGAK